MSRLGSVKERLSGAMRSRPGRDFLLYLFFVVVAFVLWILMSMDNEVQRDFDIPLELVDVPDSVVVIGNLPPSAAVSVRGKGGQLVRLTWRRHVPPLKLRFNDYAQANKLSLSRARLDARLREYFGQGVTIVSVKPDSLSLAYTKGPGVKLPLVIEADIRTALECIRSGPITASADSIRVYTVGRLPSGIKAVFTEPIERSGVKDTLRLTVGLQPVADARLIPDQVEVTIPVEPLIKRKRKVKVEVVNAPHGEAVIVFPSEVELSYLVPISRYSSDIGLHVFADYTDIQRLHGQASKLPVRLSYDPELVSSPELKPDSIEFIVEHIPLPRHE